MPSQQLRPIPLPPASDSPIPPRCASDFVTTIRVSSAERLTTVGLCERATEHRPSVVSVVAHFAETTFRTNPTLRLLISCFPTH